MVNLYHLSHFFEFLTGLYFGGLALLEFLQNKASAPFSKLLEIRRQSSNNAKTQVVEYYTIKVTAANGALRAMSNSFKWGCWCLIEYPANIAFKATHSYITSLVKNQGDFIRRHFPVFFFTGCFCLAIVLLGGLEEKEPPIFCNICLDKFFIFYCLSTIIYQIWGVFVFPFLVANNDYLVLTVINFGICILLIFLTYYFSLKPFSSTNLGYFLLPKNADKFVLIVVAISLFPIVSIIFLSGLILTLFTGTTYFYNFTLRWYRENVEVLDDIKGFEE